MSDAAPERDQADCQLLSAGSTTGWTDWIHGELWLCPDGLLRRSLGLWRTIRQFNLPSTDVRSRSTRSFTAIEIGEIMQGARRDRWISWAATERATLGRLRLQLQLRDGSRLVLLWGPIDDVTALRDRLAAFLGERLQAR